MSNSLKFTPSASMIVALIALFIALGGTAVALDGSNTVFSDDLVNGEVKVADIGPGAVATAEIANGQVLGADIGAGAVRTGNVANDNLTGGDISPNSLKGADIDEASLDIGDAVRAYARVNPDTCVGNPGTCTPRESKGVSSVFREQPGVYCIVAPGIDTNVTPAAVTVDWGTTAFRQGNASAMTWEVPGCGPDGKDFRVVTEHQPVIAVDQGGGTNNATASGPAAISNDVGFTILIP